ncbi:MAG: IMP dehydrogenase [Minisyncoccia bacterium]|jgi:IMP dehydrogenase
MRKCDKFFKELEALGLAVTYDEVRLKTDYSDVMPSATVLTSRFSRNVPLKIPITSAAMDTVTESRMAIAMAKLGGLGVIHRGFTPKEQSEEVRRVKFHLSGLIETPITIRENMTFQEVETMRRERGFSFHSFPVVDARGKLAGLITENDFDFSGDGSQKVKSVMTRDLVTAPKGTSIDKAYEIMLKAKKKVLPLVNRGNLVGMYLFSDLKRIKSGRSGKYNVDSHGRLRVAAAVGVNDDAMERAEALKGFADVLVIDTAHGDSKDVIQTIKALKKAYRVDVVAGNISRGESAKRLVAAGADGVKVGQGPGSICTTRIVAGIGCPQVTATYEVAKALEKTDVPICADGGIENSGDIPIAIGAGAHSVMLGKLLAGTKEAPGEVDFRFETPMKRYRGMGSLSAMEESRSSRERYREANTAKDRFVPEGVEGLVPYVGELETVMHQYVGGLQKGMGYVGARTIEELRSNAEFIRISAAGIKESHPHGVRIVRDAPNYRRDHA